MRRREHRARSNRLENWFRGATVAVSLFVCARYGTPRQVPQIRTAYAVPRRNTILGTRKKKTRRFFSKALECLHPRRAHGLPREAPTRGGALSRSRRGSLTPATRAAEHDERLWDSGCGSVRLSINLAVVFDPWPKQQQQEQRVGLCCFVATAVCCATIYRQQHKSRALLVRCAVRCFS